MKKQHRVLSLIVALLMIVTVGVTLAACVPGEEKELTETKELLCTALDNYKNTLLADNVYTSVNRSIVESLAIAGKVNINGSTSVADAQAAYNSAKALLDAVEIDPLPSAKQTAKNNLDKLLARLISLNIYVAADKALLQPIVTAGKNLIDASDSVEEVSSAFSTAKLQLEAIPCTRAEMTYNSYLAVSPSNWNALTYKEENDTYVMDYVTSNLFGFNFVFDSNGNIVDGKFSVEYEMASGLKDVTADYAGQYKVPENAIKSYAWKITLRQDLAWDDGTPIDAGDFVYSMMQQLDPLFRNHRADSYYNSSTVISNAKNYVYQGLSGNFLATAAFDGYDESIDSKLFFNLGNTVLGSDGKALIADFRSLMSFPASWTAAQIASYLQKNYISSLSLDVVASMEGKTLSQIKADAAMKAEWEKIIGWWQTEPNEELHFFIAKDFSWPAVSFGDVGIFVGDNDYEIILVLDKQLSLLNDDGTMAYTAAYNMQSLPLVKQDLYEATKVAPTYSGGLWTSIYNSSVATTASFGPYKLTGFQTGKQFVLERNDNWYGYGLEQFEGQYQTTKVVYDIITSWNTAWLSFQKGELNGISVDVTIAADYKGSNRAYFTPSSFIASLQLQSSKEALEGRQSSGINKTLMTYSDFRKAMSLSINRADFAKACTTSSLAGYGIFGPVHYYDVANGGVYRDTDIAKETLLLAYGFTDNGNGTWSSGGVVYPTLDDAYDAMTGYDLALAKVLINQAYDAAIAAGDLKAGDKVKLTYGSGADTESVRRTYEYLTGKWIEMVKGTKLEGKLEFEFSDRGDDWDDDFLAGAYDITVAGWQGAAWDPGYFLLAYLDPSYMYSQGWDTSSETMTLVVPGSNNGEAITMTLLDWYDALNGTTTKGYNWGKGNAEEDIRLIIIAGLERVILEQYYSCPLYYNYSASMISHKTEFVTYTYNTFMAYGGIRYMTYNYNDAEWVAYVASQGGILNYK